VKNWDVNKYLTDEEVLERFKFNLDIFMENITKIIPENKIILNRGRLAEIYTDDDEEIKTLKTINLNKKKYLASKSHTFAYSFSHYEHEYYKHFINELEKNYLKLL